MQSSIIFLFFAPPYYNTQNMNYQIIADEQELTRFIALLPDTTPDECYYVSLMARNKWIKGTEIPPIAAQVQIKRFSTSKGLLVEKLRHLECAKGTYLNKGIAIPQEALGVYITVNPRSYRRAGLRLLKDIAEHLEEERDFNPHQLALSALQATPSRKHWFDIDMDLVEGEDRATIQAFITSILGDVVTYIHTRGGMHCLVELKKITPERAKNWYIQISEQQQFKSGFDMIGDNLTPLPGCVQGGFVPFVVR